MSTQLVHAIIVIIVAPCTILWCHLSVVVSLSLLPSLRRRQYMFRHPSEPLEPHVRRVVHTHLHPGGSFFYNQECKKNISYCQHFAGLDVHTWLPVCCVGAVATGRAEPQQPGQQSGGTALPGEQEGVREEGDGHRGAELGGRLRGSTSRPPPPLHRPPHSCPSLAHFYLIETTTTKKKKIEQLYQKNSSATLKKRKNETTKPQWTYKTNMLANTFKENRRGGINLMFVFPFFFF